jgi:hypothetical protein
MCLVIMPLKLYSTILEPADSPLPLPVGCKAF